MTAATLLDRLDGVRQTGTGRWRARCPAHDGRNTQVLSISEGSDGTVLIKCFAGCSALAIVNAVGLELHDLFPRVEWQASGNHAPLPRRPRVDWPALIGACERDLILVKIVLAMIGRGEPVNADDATACQVAATRVYQLIQEQHDIDAAHVRASARAREREVACG